MVQIEKLVNHCDMELMKMAMLSHEETFRQQVHELHRLYRVQKQLMTSGGGALSRPSSELISRRRRRQIKIRRGCLRQPRRAMDLRLPADDYILVVGAGNNATPPPQRQEDGLELTLAVGTGSRRKRREDDEGAGTTGTPVGSDCCSGGSLTTSSSITDTTRGSPPLRLQEGAAAAVTRQQPPWLVQCLRLKMA